MVRASAGADIVLLVRRVDDPSVRSTVNQIQQLGQRVSVHRCDLSSRADILAVVPEVCEIGGHNIDIVVHCGGIQHRTPAVDFPDDAWDNIINVLLSHALLIGGRPNVKSLLPGLVDSRSTLC